MAPRLSLTAANSVYILSIDTIYPQGVQLQGFAADAAFATETIEPSEVLKGVDGIMSAGFVPYMTPQTINIQADSPSAIIFENWAAYMKAQNEVLWANATISLPSIGRKYIMTGGVLTQFAAIPGTQKILQPREFRITWDNVDPAPL